MLYSICFTALFMFLKQNKNINIEANLFWFIISGAIWGLLLIVPGLSSSSLLIMMGLYQKITSAIANFDFTVILPVVFGLLVTVLSLSKLVSNLFEKHRKQMILFISGIMIASAICMFIQVKYIISDIPVYLVIFAIGFVIALKFNN